MSEFNRIIAIERMCAPGIAWAIMSRMHKQVREHIEYMRDLAEAVEICRRMSRAVGGEVEP